jgi:hypothetical protein
MRFRIRNRYRVGADPGGISEMVSPLARMAVARSAFPDG